jgi:hypothetical protein
VQQDRNVLAEQITLIGTQDWNLAQRVDCQEIRRVFDPFLSQFNLAESDRFPRLVEPIRVAIEQGGTISIRLHARRATARDEPGGAGEGRGSGAAFTCGTRACR